MALLVGKETCRDLEQAGRREWLETNGIGGFASSTIVGMNTRRYHGLLVPALHPPHGRIVALSCLQERATSQGEVWEFSCNRYVGAVHPEGYRYLQHFRLDPFPVFTYRLGDIEIEKQVFMIDGQNTTAVVYRPVSGEVTLELQPLVAFRDYHHLTRQNPSLNGGSRASDGTVTLEPYPGLPPMTLRHNGQFEEEGSWYYQFEYAEEAERGLDSVEDLYSPGKLTFHLQPGDRAVVLASTESDAEAALSPDRIDELRETEVARRRGMQASSDGDPFRQMLAASGDAFVVKGGNGRSSIIAGYPWFTDWGRDTMIALPGLTLVTGRFEEARSILNVFAGACRDGLIPNRFTDSGEGADYNSVDASLWFLHAVGRYLDYTGDEASVSRDLWPVMAQILECYRDGTHYGIRTDADGLLLAGEDGTQLTWMDAKVDDWVVTPRRGKPVEVNALWHHGLRVGAALAERFGDPDRASRFGADAERVKEAFERTFWNETQGCLYDVVDGETRDASVRPNQVLALSLPESLISARRARRILQVVESRLLTPLGLRSLAPEEDSYRGIYTGDAYSRDGAYHQGTVWGWLIGPFVTAFVRVHGGSAEARQEAARYLEPFQQHLYDAGLGHISEVFDGDPGHTPKGCYAQAWSTAEVHRALVEDVMGIRPEFEKDG